MKGTFENGICDGCGSENCNPRVWKMIDNTRFFYCENCSETHEIFKKVIVPKITEECKVEATLRQPDTLEE